MTELKKQGGASPEQRAIRDICGFLKWARQHGTDRDALLTTLIHDIEVLGHVTDSAESLRTEGYAKYLDLPPSEAPRPSIDERLEDEPSEPDAEGEDLNPDTPPNGEPTTE